MFAAVTANIRGCQTGRKSTNWATKMWLWCHATFWATLWNTGDHFGRLAGDVCWNFSFKCCKITVDSIKYAKYRNLEVIGECDATTLQEEAFLNHSLNVITSWTTTKWPTTSASVSLGKCEKYVAPPDFLCRLLQWSRWHCCWSWHAMIPTIPYLSLFVAVHSIATACSKSSNRKLWLYGVAIAVIMTVYHLQSCTFHFGKL